MTKKDFIALADCIKQHNATCSGVTQEFTEFQIETLAEFCAGCSRKFDKWLWMKYLQEST